MFISKFSEYLSRLESISSRTEVTEVLAELIGELSKDEVKESMYMIQGRLAPKYVDLEFNMSRKMILSALGDIYGEKEVKALFKELGDVGLVAENVVEKLTEGFETNELTMFENVANYEYKDIKLNIQEVFQILKVIADLSGKGSTEQKTSKYKTLIHQLDPVSSRYITRVIVGSLRLGLSDKTLLDALSWYLKGDKSLRKDFDSAFGARADVGALASLIITNKDPEKALSEITIEPGVPVASKLVEREKSVEKVWERMPGCFAQPKLDGLRGQLHKWKDSEGATHVEIYSRNMENMTEQFPDLVNALKQSNVDSIILDSEIIGFNQETGEYLSYQETMQRKRKYDIAEKASEIPVKSMCFDVLEINGKDISKEPIEDRIDVLKKFVKENDSKNIEMLETIKFEALDDLDEYFERLVGDGLEGIIVKEPGTTYEPGSRNFKWIKLKANSKSELVDTIDVVIVGYYIGRGQRAKFGVGAFLTAVYDPQKDMYYSFGKVGSGITDELFKKINEDIKDLEIEKKPDNVDVEKQLYPDVWLTPKIIIEIDGDEITRSPFHTAAKGITANVPKDDSSRGLSIRFPRLKVWDRDKDQPNTVSEIVRMYELRKGN